MARIIMAICQPSFGAPGAERHQTAVSGSYINLSFLWFVPQLIM